MLPALKKFRILFSLFLMLQRITITVQFLWQQGMKIADQHHETVLARGDSKNGG
jgi:hypothetical protein